MTTRVAVLGGTGFVGRHVMKALLSRSVEVVPISAPRLTTQARALEGLLDQLAVLAPGHEAARLRDQLAGCAVVINAAGVADATASGDVVFGANALLPGLISLVTPASARVVHVSSAAVQGRRPVLDETEEYAPFSDYSLAKVLGEQAARGVRPSVVIFRPTSVQGLERRVTQQLTRIASSRLSFVGGRGDRATPQVLAENVGDAIAYLALTPETPPPVVLQPWEGLTTASLLTLLGGRRPRRVPMAVGKCLIGVLFLAGRRSSRVAGIARRVEMLWLGQEQKPGWLTGRWSAPVGIERWKEIA